MNHAPAPWVENQHRILAADGSTVCDMMPHRVEAENARLIAAAPDLLAACKLALARIESDIEGINHVTPEGEMLRKIIAKAEGN